MKNTIKKDVVLKITLTIVGLLFTSSTLLSAQASNFTYQYFGTENGLPSKVLKCIFRDSRDLVWIGTGDAGLSVYDGTSFQNFPLRTSKSDSLAVRFDGAISGISEDTLGRIWVGTNIGIFIISLADNSTFLAPIQDKNGRPFSIVALTQTSDGYMWMVCGNAPYFIKATTKFDINLISSPHTQKNNTLVEDKHGLLWSRGNKEGTLVKTTKEGFQTVVDIGLEDVPELAASPQKDLIVIPLYSKKLMVLAEDQTRLVPYKSPSHQISVNFINQLKTKVPFYIKNFSFDFILKYFIFNTNETILIATSHGLFAVQAHKKNLPFQTIHELSGKHLRLIHPINNNEFYVSADTFFKWNRPTHDLEPLKTDIEVWTLTPFQGDSMLLTLAGQDFFMFDTTNNAITLFKPKIEGGKGFLEENYISFKDSKNILRSGCYQFNSPDSLMIVQDCANKAINDVKVYAMIEDQAGIIWMGTSVGLFKKDSCHVSLISLPTELGLIKINALYERNKTEIIIGTRDQGVYRYHKEKGILATYNTKNGLSDNQVCSILSNDSIGIWVSTYHGLNYINLESNHIHSFFEQDGLANNEFNRYSACKLPNGDLLFGGMKGCTVVPHDIKLSTQNTSDLRITGYSKVNKKTQRFDKQFFDAGNQSLTLKPDEVYIEFSFANSNLIENKNIKFAHFLEGVDEDWILCGKNTSARYTNLDAGAYKFFTRMKTPNGSWQTSTNWVALQVNKYFYESDWFKVAIGLGFSFILFLINYYRLYQKRKANQFKEKLVDDLHDDIGGSLNNIQKIIAQLQNKNIPIKELKEELTQVSHLSNEAVVNMTDVIWAVNPNYSTIKDLVTRIQDMADDIFPVLKVPFDLQIENISIHSPINFQTRYQLLMICKEGFTNIIKHTESDQVLLELKEHKGQFIFRLQNDFTKKKADAKSTLIGLKSIKKRAEILDGIIEIINQKNLFSLILKIKKFY